MKAQCKRFCNNAKQDCKCVSYLFKCLGAGQKITNAVNPSINLLFSVSLNCMEYDKVKFYHPDAP